MGVTMESHLDVTDEGESDEFVSNSDQDTDDELKEAFAAGLLKPGLNIVGEIPARREFKNNTALLEQKLSELTKKMPWIERLDMINEPAPVAPELAFKEEEHSRLRQKLLANTKSSKSIEEDAVHNDFKREMMFYRQAQSAVIEGISRLHSQNIPTKRPEDYFAQMVKTDLHMQKIREKLLTKQQEQERTEKIRKLRELKKYGKKVQVEVQQNRAKEKRQLMDNVKKFRKGKLDDLDFLEKNGNKPGSDSNRKTLNDRRKFKNDKFGFGGKKRGLKKNTKESADNVSDYRTSKGKRQNTRNTKTERAASRKRKKKEDAK
uniref:Putative rRNA-processing protein ebp2-like protein n=1 Tax=Acartia pacifica TaxID=335913 RepID=A0A0U2LF01_ACAPC|nr:putative rRNA-processing protein ebp2-like protein [Acartia pacifica]